MSARRILVGAIGGDGQGPVARELGAAVARADCILLTGGGGEDGDEVKNATIHGAIAAEGNGSVARFVGILPGEHVGWERRGPNGFLLRTGLKHYMRNLINGVTPDIVIVFGGSRGTLAEAAFAAAAGRETLFYSGQEGGAVARLRANFETYFGQSGGSDVEKFLGRPLTLWPRFASQPCTAERLRLLLRDWLRQATDWRGSADELVAHCSNVVRSSGPLETTGFPGLPGDAASKQRFESEIERISYGTEAQR